MLYRALFFLALMLWLQAGLAADEGATANAYTRLNGNKVLIIGPRDEETQDLKEILTELYAAEVSITSTEHYNYIIDEYYYDAFVYFGSIYETPPAWTFIEDMERTNKPVLWINYHGWLLSEEFFENKGIEIYDEHDQTYETILFGEPIPLTPTDTSKASAGPDKVLYRLLGNGAALTPGALHSENFTYIAYQPNLDIFAPDFFPFLTALRFTFGQGPAPLGRPPPPSFQERLAATRQDSLRTGIHLPIYTATAGETGQDYGSDELHANLIRIKQSGAEWVTVVRTLYQEDIRASYVFVDEFLTPTFEALENIIDDAHRLGLLVRLSIAVNLVERKPNHWRGMIHPNDPDEWWISYTGLMREIGEFARDNEVESLMIGTELSLLQRSERRWRQLVDTVRNEAGYPGLIGYELNYNALEINWADALDFLGISAYWPLSQGRDPSVQALDASWKRIGAKLGKWMDTLPGVAVEFTEVGYASQPYASLFPFSWKPFRGKGRSLSEQLECYRSLLKFLRATPAIRGVHVFASTEEDTDPESRGYTPFGKPAEQVMKQMFSLR